MRNLLLMIASVVAISACSDRDQLTSPTDNLPRAEAGVRAPSGASAEVGKAPSAKPTDQVGFTKTFVVVGVGASLERGVNESGYSTATCPAGSVAVGGGYETYGGPVYGDTDLRITRNRANSNTQLMQWGVSGHMVGNTDAFVGFFAIVVCAQ